MIIDTHLHLIDLSALRYPWLSREPALNRDFPHAEYAIQARRAGIEAALHMEVDVDEADIQAETSHVKAQSLEKGSLLRGAIASCRPEEAGFAAYLERQQADPFVKGFRRVLHVMPDELSDSALFRENIERLAGTGLTFDLVVLPHQIPRAVALADLAPDVQFVLDHCGVPDIKASAEHPWREHMTEIARRPNVLRCRRLCRCRLMDRRDLAPLCRAHDRHFRLGPRRVGQRLAGVHAWRWPCDLGGGDACVDCGSQP
ncbi:amidohydrolase [Mesorhizobium sp. L103C120A0]|nr:amidohydrolase [Mesorhizobium sp. L103C120A0]